MLGADLTLTAAAAVACGGKRAQAPACRVGRLLTPWQWWCGKVVNAVLRGCRFAMTRKASAKGWVIRVTKPRVGRPPSVDIYDVAISGANDAIEAVRRVCESGTEAIVETIAELPEGTDLRDGEVILR